MAKSRFQKWWREQVDESRRIYSHRTSPPMCPCTACFYGSKHGAAVRQVLFMFCSWSGWHKYWLHWMIGLAEYENISWQPSWCCHGRFQSLRKAGEYGLGYGPSLRNWYLDVVTIEYRDPPRLKIMASRGSWRMRTFEEGVMADGCMSDE